MEEIDIIKNSIQIECIEKISYIEKGMHDSYYRKEEIQAETSSIREKVNEVISDTQKKFQRVDFDLSNLRDEMKDLATKNLTFRNDILGAIREIKDICRTNTTAINKLSEDMKIVRDDMNYKIDVTSRSLDSNITEVGDLITDLNN